MCEELLVCCMSDLVQACALPANCAASAVVPAVAAYGVEVADCVNAVSALSHHFLRDHLLRRHAALAD